MSYKLYRPLEQGEFFVVGVDTAAGGNDYVSAQFVSKNNIDVPLTYHSKQTITEFTNEVPRVLEIIHRKTGVVPTIAYERNNGGAFELDRLAMLNRHGHYNIYRMKEYGKVEAGTTPRYGWDTNSATRPKMLQDLKEAVDKMVIRIYDERTIKEMLSFVVVPTSSSWKAQAEVGSHDDTIMALAIAFQLYQNVQPPMDYTKTYIPQNNFEKWSIS